MTAEEISHRRSSTFPSERPAELPPRSRRQRRRGELIVLSHLRWDWVWQRPQHIVSRLAKHYERTVFVEEPVLSPTATEPTIRRQPAGAVERVWLELPGEARHCGFDGAGADTYADLLASELGRHADRTVWLYTPLALPHAEQLRPTTLAFDVMDDLAAFASASPALHDMHVRALRRADVVFTGGRSLQRGVVPHRPDAWCCPSGVELEHFAVARELRPASNRARPVAGYVGVVDERLDLDLIAGVARELPDWEIQIVGPTAKIDPAMLPDAPNLRYFGPRAYADLPAVMAGFDVALMPFALNEATRSISPTKTMEYLAAGLPIVSTRVPDVVTDFSTIVSLADDAPSFADACRTARSFQASGHHTSVKRILRWNHWDAIVDRMQERLDDGSGERAAEECS